MNTLTTQASFLKSSRARDNVIALDGLEFVFSKKDLDRITKLHNEGIHYKDISKQMKRDPYEIIIALLHQVRAGKGIRPFAQVINDVS